MNDTLDMKAPAEMLDLSNRVVIVTGAGGVVGTGIAQRLLAAGATVVAATRSSPVEHLVDRSGVPVTNVMADLTTDDGPGIVVATTIGRYGRVDALVNNAGIQPTVNFGDMSDKEWSDMIDTNLTAVHRLTQHVSGAMRSSGRGGSIVHIASIEATHPTPVHGHYATSKAAVVMHAKAAALSFGSDNIRVNAVSPGLIARPGLNDEWPEGVRRWNAAAPLKRLGTPADVGDACVFLVSDLSRWITGTELVVDGGVRTNQTW